MPKLIIITGSPSSGKTEIIKSLENKGYTCFHEISREVTLEARQKGIDQLFISDPLLFSEILLKGRIKQHKEASKSKSDYVFLDRGIPDIIAYLDRIDSSYPSFFDEACRDFVYDEVFILPPWKEIFTKDNERYEDFDEAKIVFEYLKNAYDVYEYNHTHVPIGTVEQRVNYILHHLNSN